MYIYLYIDNVNYERHLLHVAATKMQILFPPVKVVTATMLSQFLNPAH